MFVATTPVTTTTEPEEAIENHAFFPRLSLTEFRAAMRVDGVTTEDRARQALHTAMLEVNDRLAQWATQKISEGFSELCDVPERFGSPTGSNKARYKHAVWSLAKASLVERYRDYDTSRTGADKADELIPIADDYRRDAAWAIRDLQGLPRTVSELI